MKKANTSQLYVDCVTQTYYYYYAADHSEWRQSEGGVKSV